MHKYLLLVHLLICFSISSYCQDLQTEVIIDSLNVPWEILWGPDDNIWVSERAGIVSKIDPSTGEKTTLVTIDSVYQSGESGLLGMALHPNFIDTPNVFLVYTYLNSGIKERLVKYTYAGDSLSNPQTLIENIEGSTNHNGSRIIVTSDHKLLMTTGDASNTNLSQDNSSLSGKILRINLDGSIPSDNPNPNSYIYSKGLRNPQGLVLAPNGNIYSSEHGPSSDDELNIILSDRNYGWPDVKGFCDEPTEATFCNDSNVVKPIFAWTPTLAVAGIDFYNHPAIPEWQNSILLTTLKEDDLRVLRLNSTGDSVLSEEILYNNDFGRIRDLCIAPNGDVYIATSNKDGRANDGFPIDLDDRIIRMTPIVGTKIDHTKKAAATIFPNPALDLFTLNVSQIQSEVHFLLIDLRGSIVKEIYSKENQLDILTNDLPSGLYQYVVRGKGLQTTGKLIVLSK